MQKRSTRFAPILLLAGLLVAELPAANNTNPPPAFSVTLKKNGQTLTPSTPVTLRRGTQLWTVRADVCEALLEGYLNKLKATGRINSSGQPLSILDATSVASSTNLAAQAKQRAVLRTASLGYVPGQQALALTQSSNSLAPRAALTQTRVDSYSASWAESLGDPRYVALGLSSDLDVTSSPRWHYVQASFDARLTFFNQSMSLLAGRIDGMAVASDLGWATAQLELFGIAFWAQPSIWTTNTTLNVTNRLWTRTDTLTSVTVMALFIPVQLRAVATSSIGMEARVTLLDRFSNSSARGALVGATVQSMPRMLGATPVEGAFGSVGIYGVAMVAVSLRSVAADFGIEELLEFIDAIPGVAVPWTQDLAGAGVAMGVQVLTISLRIQSSSTLRYVDTSSTQAAGKYSLTGSAALALKVRAISDPSINVFAFVSYPSGVDVSFQWGWPPVEITIDFDQITADANLWSFTGALYESDWITIYNRYFDVLVQQSSAPAFN